MTPVSLPPFTPEQEKRLALIEQRLTVLEAGHDTTGALHRSQISRLGFRPGAEIDARTHMDALREERETSWRLIVLISVIVIVAALWLAERMV